MRMTTYRSDVFRIPMRGPGDAAGLIALFDSAQLDPRHIIAILGKTEGNGGVNDFTREYGHHVFVETLAARLGIERDEVDGRIAIVMSGGTEGVLSPHATIFAKVPVTVAAADGKRLAIGVAQTRDFAPEELGRGAQITQTAHAVQVAMLDAGIDDPADVHFVQIKCPLLTAARVEDARRRGNVTVTDDGYASMGYSRGASALGIALGLGEIQGPISDDAVLADFSRCSSVASTSAGIELLRNVIIVMGNASGLAGDLRIGHSVMRDAIDLAGALEAFAGAGVDATIGDVAKRSARIVNVFAKAESSPNGAIRGERHTMLDDTDISATRHARAAVGGLLAGLAGSGAIYVSGGAEHQGPPGGGPVAVIAKI
jgi:cyanuric acid amidohydrolase